MSILEVNVSIICACGPALPLFFRRVVPRLFTDPAHSGHELHHAAAASHANTFRHQTADGVPGMDITKTVVHTISVVQPKDSDSVTELVDSASTGGTSNGNLEGGSFATTHTKDSYKNGW